MLLSIVVYLNLGLLLPTIPAGIGIYQFFSIQALNHFDINSSSALSFSFILQFLDIVPTFILAMYFMYFDKTIFQKIFK